MSAQSLIVDSPPLVGTPRVAVCPSAGLRRIRHLTAFLALDTVLSPGEARRAGVTGDVVLAWGRKPSARRAERFARARGLPLWYLEDGWIRSASADAHSPTCYSVLVDPVGVYYDSSRPSAIERFLNRPDAEVAGDLDAVTLARAGRARQRLVAANITKYNYCPTSRLPVEDGREIVLVVVGAFGFALGRAASQMCQWGTRGASFLGQHLDREVEADLVVPAGDQGGLEEVHRDDVVPLQGRSGPSRLVPQVHTTAGECGHTMATVDDGDADGGHLLSGRDLLVEQLAEANLEVSGHARNVVHHPPRIWV